MRRQQNTDRLLPVAAVIVLLVVWEIACRAFAIESYVLPAPTRIIAVFVDKFSLLMMHASYTLYEAVIGLLLSCLFGIVAALLMYRFRYLEKVASPLIVISQTVPIIALAPLVLIWFGMGIGPKVGIVVLVCFFPVTISALAGFKASDPAMISLMRTMGAKSNRIFREVCLPSAAPQIFVGIRMAATYSVMGAVIGEWLGARAGLGIFMTRAISSYRADMLFAAVLIVVIISLALYAIVGLCEWLLLPWKRKTTKGV